MLRKHPDLVRSVPVRAHPPDVDRPADLRSIDRP
jgi:hypothetical protein